MKQLLFLICFFIAAVGMTQDDYVNESEATEPVKKAKNRVFSGIPNPDFTNYTLTASSYTLNSRDFRISGTDLLFAKVSYGLKTNTTVSGHISLLGTLVGSVKQKVNLADGLDLGFSASLGRVMYAPTDSVVALAGGQSMITMGDHQNNLTAGIGIYYTHSNFDLLEDKEDVFFNHVYAAYHRQLWSKIYLVAEGMYYWDYNTFIGSVVAKFIIKRKYSICVGVMPLARDGRISPNRTVTEAGVIPVLSYRWFIDR